MTITVSLNQEQQDAVALRAAAAVPPTTVEAILAALVTAQVDQWVKDDFTNAVNRLGEMAAGLSYADRKAIIAQVQQTITGE